MRSAILFTIVSAFVATTAASAAPTIAGNPASVTYVATIPTSNSIKGSLKLSAGPGGVGTTGILNLSDLPETGGPFSYHIHVNPVNASGSCDSTGGHLDPYNVGDTPCKSSNPEDCQVGDLSGKYGAVTGTTVTSTFNDEFTSLLSGTPAFVGNRSFVIHAADKSRIACANFELVDASKGNGAGSASPTGSGGGSAANGTGNGGGATHTAVLPSSTPTGGAVTLAQNMFGLLVVLAVGAAAL